MIKKWIHNLAVSASADSVLMKAWHNSVHYPKSSHLNIDSLVEKAVLRLSGIVSGKKWVIHLAVNVQVPCISKFAGQTVELWLANIICKFFHQHSNLSSLVTSSGECSKADNFPILAPKCNAILASCPRVSFYLNSHLVPTTIRQTCDKWGPFYGKLHTKVKLRYQDMSTD